ncbi:DUF3667 domain-containing protein [Microbulbifer sp. ANSA005]|uniref:DUF3667 domain-containing protein n=1 Tax=Microbulbifer sp. ANSA005 TaxID=3243362 RepID=UPI0040438EEE
MGIKSRKEASVGRQDYCSNCNTILLGHFCYGCGQSAEGIVRRLSSVIRDFLNTLVAFDSRLWRTLPALLLSPGFLTIEYLSGRRARYVSPVKLFIFLCVSAFFLIRISSDWSIAQEQPIRTSDNVAAKMAPSSTGETEKQFDWDLPGGRKLDIRGAENKQEVWSISFNRVLSIFEKKVYTVEFMPQSWRHWFDIEFKKARSNIERVSENPTIFAKAFFGSLPTMLLLMLPIYSGILWVLYACREKLYMEHVIVSLHSHAYVSLTLLLGTAIFLLQEFVEPLFWMEILCYGVLLLLFLWMPINLLLMQKNIYKEGWVSTCIKYSVLNFVYLPLIILCTVMAAFYSLAKL